jgi:hypothetical protein
LIHKLARDGGDAAHALKKIEDNAFAGEQHASVVANDSYRLVLVKPDAIKNFWMSRNFVVRCNSAIQGGVDLQNARDAADA